MDLPVHKCVCHDLEFDSLKDLAREMSMDFDRLRAWSGCCTGCGMCEPYVRLMLETGRTRFAPLSPDAAAEVVARGRSGKPE